ncbi:hypothetical protein vseg_021056 [Gypsophila vaccaria]
MNRKKDNYVAESSNVISNDSGYDEKNSYDLWDDVGSSSMMPHYEELSWYSMRKTNSHLADHHHHHHHHHQYNVGNSVSDNSMYRGFKKTDDLSLAMEFQRLNVGSVNDVVRSSFDHGRDPSRVSVGGCNAVKFRPSYVEDFGWFDGGASPLYKDEFMCRLSGERASGFQQSSPRVDEFFYGNGDAVMRGNRLYGYDGSNDYVVNGGRVSSVNGNGNLTPRGNQFPARFQSMYGGAPVLDDALQQYIMEGCKEVMNPWTSSRNYGALLPNNGGHVSELLHSRQALSRRNVLYNTMLEKMRASEQRDSASIALFKKMSQPCSGVGLNGSIGRRKNLFSCHTHKTGDMSFDFNAGSGSPVGSCDSLIYETMYSSLAEVKGNIYQMAKDQHGCRFLQKKFEDGSFEDLHTIFNEIIDHVVELMTNPFANYLIQKLLDVCSEEQRMKIVHGVTKDHGELVRICLNTHGTRVVQKLIDSLKTRNQILLMIRALEPVFLDLIQDLNGNHVVQRCLQCLDCDDNKFIFDAAAQFCVEIATHRHGCCVLQRCIAHSTGDHRKKLIDKICSNGLILAQDPFGNYVVQYIIELKVASAAVQLMAQFEGNYVQLATQKFSSHVVEKCLKYIEGSQARIVYELLSVPHFEQLLQDPYANYVVQSALEVTEGSLHKSLVAAVRPHSTLRTNPYCKKIFTRGLINN